MSDVLEGQMDIFDFKENTAKDENKELQKIKVLSLFDGISCGMVALERAGIQVERYVAYEIDEEAIKISTFNYPNIEHKGDVFNAEYQEGKFDLLIGGSPCTFWSVARTRGGKKKIDGLKTINSDKSHTLTTSKTHPMNYYLNEDKTKYCNLSINDWEKLQTLPEGYVDKVNIKQGAKYKGIGNGWTVDVISHILRGIKG